MIFSRLGIQIEGYKSYLSLLKKSEQHVLIEWHVTGVEFITKPG